MSISHCLTTTEFDFDQNTGVSQRDQAQQDRGKSSSFSRLGTGAGQLLPSHLILSSPVKDACLSSTWHYCVAQKLSSRMSIVIAQNLAKLVGPPMISDREKNEDK